MGRLSSLVSIYWGYDIWLPLIQRPLRILPRSKQLDTLLSRQALNTRDLREILQNHDLGDARLVTRFVAWVKNQTPSDRTDDSSLTLDENKKAEIGLFVSTNEKDLRVILEKIAKHEPVTLQERFLDAYCRGHLPELCAVVLRSLINNAPALSTNLGLVRQFHKKIAEQARPTMLSRDVFDQLPDSQ